MKSTMSIRGSAGKKNFGDAGFFQCGDVRFGDDAANQHGDIVHAFLAKQFHKLRTKRVVRSRKNRQADDVHVLLHRGGSNHLRGLPQAGIDHFHPGIAQRASNNFGAAVMAIKPGLGNQHANSFRGHVLWIL